MNAHHKLFGHGIPGANKLSAAENNANAIRTDNLVRRLLNIEQRDGSDHGGYNEGQITNPYQLPIKKNQLPLTKENEKSIARLYTLFHVFCLFRPRRI